MNLVFEWFGGPTTILERGGLRVLTDPMLGPRGPNAFVLPQHPSTGAANASISRYTATPAPRLEGLAAIMVSHGHADHVDAVAKQILPKDLPVVAPLNAVDALRAAGFREVRGLDWGERTQIAELEVLAVPAHHAHDAALDTKLGRGNGYILSWPDGYRIYWTGDSVVNDETTREVAKYAPFDLMLIHLGGVGGDGEIGLRSMTSDEALELARRVEARVIVPIHHTTFSHYREPIEALVQRADARFCFPIEGKEMIL